ncbi:MAG: zeta toxin family protein [Candidatus Adiutrix sp.]
MTVNIKQPQLIMISGPNGAGKSTFTKNASIAQNYPVIDADKIAKDLNLSAVAAAREASRQIKSHIANNESFVRESTLTANYDFNLMAEVKQKGYKISMVYIGLNSKEMSQARVNTRSSLGGHDVPSEDIVRRFQKSVHNLFKAILIADEVKVYDNSGLEREKVATFKKGHLIKQDSNPAWFQDEN